jgi:hypothetical protein
MTPRSIALAAAMLAAFSMTVPASAQTYQDGVAARGNKARVHKRAERPLIAARREACTKTGCLPLPPGCSTTMEQTWAGPTGYEIIHCP